MKRLVQIVSLATLITVVAAMVAQALTVTQGITYDQNGQPVNPSTLTLIVTILGLEQRFAWFIAVLVAGLLALAGFFVMIWILLSVESPIAFQTPFVLVPLVTLAYTLSPAHRRTVAAGVY